MLCLLVVVCSFNVVSAQTNVESEKIAVLRKFTREIFKGKTDRQIVKKLFPTVQLKKKSVNKKILKELIQSLSDSSDCARYCAGSTGSYKISCYQHCQRYNL